MGLAGVGCNSIVFSRHKKAHDAERVDGRVNGSRHKKAHDTERVDGRVNGSRHKKAHDAERVDGRVNRRAMRTSGTTIHATIHVTHILFVWRTTCQKTIQ